MTAEMTPIEIANKGLALREAARIDDGSGTQSYLETRFLAFAAVHFEALAKRVLEAELVSVDLDEVLLIALKVVKLRGTIDVDAFLLANAYIDQEKERQLLVDVARVAQDCKTAWDNGLPVQAESATHHCMVDALEAWRKHD